NLYPGFIAGGDFLEHVLKHIRWLTVLMNAAYVAQTVYAQFIKPPDPGYSTLRLDFPALSGDE
ncbi:MAG: hypothetical protein ACLFRL_06325, partial [Desulfohalobiaceae bacterium]